MLIVFWKYGCCETKSNMHAATVALEMEALTVGGSFSNTR